MLIHEAIKAAGPGGTIRREGWNLSCYWIIGHNGFITHSLDGELVGTSKWDNLTATDWEVIEPERIEVGDTVGNKGCSWPEGVVKCIGWFDASMSTCIETDKGVIVIQRIENLTLIRKGPKHPQPLDDAITLLKAVLDRPVEGGQSILNPRDRSDIETFLKEVGE